MQLSPNLVPSGPCSIPRQSPGVLGFRQQSLKILGVHPSLLINTHRDLQLWGGKTCSWQARASKQQYQPRTQDSWFPPGHDPGGFLKEFPGRLMLCLWSTSRSSVGGVSFTSGGWFAESSWGVWNLVRFLGCLSSCNLVRFLLLSLFCFIHFNRCVSSHVLLTCPHQSLSTSLLSSLMRYSRFTLSFPYPTPGMRHSSKALSWVLVAVW